MEMITKIAFMGVVKSPTWGLSPEQVLKIEAVVDGSQETLSGGPLVLTYDEAARRIGLTAKNRTKTICLWVRQGKLKAVSPGGSKAIGVTVESVEEFARNYKAVKGEARRES